MKKVLFYIKCTKNLKTQETYTSGREQKTSKKKDMALTKPERMYKYLTKHILDEIETSEPRACKSNHVPHNCPACQRSV